MKGYPATYTENDHFVDQLISDGLTCGDCEHCVAADDSYRAYVYNDRSQACNLTGASVSFRDRPCHRFAAA